MKKRTLWAFLALVTLAVVLPAVGPVTSGARAAKKTRGISGATRMQPGAMDHSSVGPNEDDPDLPGFLAGKIDKGQYLQLRERYVNRLRGVPYDLPYEPRVKALR